MGVESSEQDYSEALEEACELARDMGREAGRAAGSWAADGNTSEEHARKVLGLLEDGAPEAYYYLPRSPSLSGEWADDLTPVGLAEQCGIDPAGPGGGYDSAGEALCAAWEEGAGETFEDACVQGLRGVLGLAEGDTLEDETLAYRCPGGCGRMVNVHVDSDAAHARPACEGCADRAMGLSVSVAPSGIVSLTLADGRGVDLVLGLADDGLPLLTLEPNAATSLEGEEPGAYYLMPRREA